MIALASYLCRESCWHPDCYVCRTGHVPERGRHMQALWRNAAALLLGLAALQGAAVGQEPADAKVNEEFEAILTNISNVGGAGLTPVTIRINRWTSDADNERLLGTLRKDGQTSFLNALLDQKPVGSIGTPVSLRYDFFYARQGPLDGGGRRIMLISDRPMQMWERMESAPSRDYPFTVLELRLDEEGRGSGTLAQLVQLRLVGNILGIENLATGPMRLSEVKKVK